MKGRFLAKRVHNLIGDSELDDPLSKDFIRLLEEHLEIILSSRDSDTLYYEQGYVAALRNCIEKVRLYNKKQIAQEEEDND